MIEEKVQEFLRIAESRKHDSNSIETLVSPGEPVVLYGAGQCLSNFKLTILDKYPLNVAAVLDKAAKAGDVWNGIPVFTPSEYKNEHGAETAIITIGKAEYFPEVTALLLKMGLKKVIPVTDIYQFNTMYAPEAVEKEKYLYFKKYAERMIEAGNLLNDSESVEVFLRFAETYICRVPQRVPCHPMSEQYFPSDIFGKETFKRVIHCGGYHGETIQLLNKRYGKSESIVCIEGNIENFKIMQKNLFPERKNIADELVLIPCLLGGENTLMSFVQDDIVSRSTQTGNVVVPAVTLDSLLLNFSPTYITMDIEGAELAAIEGAAGVIKSSRSSLAISVYHEPAHLWEIMLKLKEFLPEYKFALRNYTGWVGDTILYAF